MWGRLTVALLGAAFLLPASALAVPDGGLELVSRPGGFGPPPTDAVQDASLGRHAVSQDGCYAVVETSNDLLSATDDDRGTDVFRVSTGACAGVDPTPVLASATPAGVAADRGAFSPSISADGTKVAFTA